MIVDEEKGFTIACLKRLHSECGIPFAELQHVCVCYELTKEHPEHLDCGMPESTAVTLARAIPEEQSNWSTGLPVEQKISISLCSSLQNWKEWSSLITWCIVRCKAHQHLCYQLHHWIAMFIETNVCTMSYHCMKEQAMAKLETLKESGINDLQ